MVDWLTIRVEVSNHDIMRNGAVYKVDGFGVNEWLSPSRYELIGSYESAIFVRSIDTNVIEISGNVNKHFQGHNLWGSSDVMGLSLYVSQYVTEIMGLENYGVLSISRVDLAVLIQLESQKDVETFVGHIGHSATVVQRGRGSLVGGSTVYFGQRSRRWSLKIYNKHREILSNKSAFDLNKAAEIAHGKLRLELVLRGIELKRLGLHKFAGWSSLDISMMLREFLEKITIPEQNPRVAWEKMPRAVRSTFVEWARGDDIKTSVSRPTFYRHRRIILEAFNVDIAAPPLEKIDHIDQLIARYGAVKKLPRLSEMPFWEPSAAERTMLPTFDPSDFV